MSDTNRFSDLIMEKGWIFRLRCRWYRYVVFPREQRQWDKAVALIRKWDYYVISDYEYFRAMDKGVVEETRYCTPDGTIWNTEQAYHDAVAAGWTPE